MPGRRWVFVGLFMAAACARADDAAPADWRALNRLARQQAQAEDYAALRDTLLKLAPLMPGSAVVAYNLAASEARLGRGDESLAHLRELADAGLAYDLGRDADFAPLAERADFRAVAARLAPARPPVGGSKRLAALSHGDGLPESLAWDAAGRRVFVASVRHCEVRVLDDPRRRGARERLFARVPASAFALGIDRARGRLWVTIATVAQGERCGEGPPKAQRTALLALDLRNGRVLQRVDAGLPGVLGDLVVADDGTVVVSESLHGAVLRLAPGARAFERLDAAGEFTSPQQPALSADGRTLFVPDYARGVAAMSLDAPHEVRWVPHAAGVFTAGIDGLVRDGDGFLAVQNGLAPARVVRFSSDFSRQQVVEAGTPGLGEPTHAVVVDAKAWFVSDVGWDRLDDDGRAKKGAAPARPEVRER